MLKQGITIEKHARFFKAAEWVQQARKTVDEERAADMFCDFCDSLNMNIVEIEYFASLCHRQYT